MQIKKNEMTNTIPKLSWRLQEIASATGLSVEFLRKKEREGVLKTKHVGRCVVVMDFDLKLFLEGSEKNAK